MGKIKIQYNVLQMMQEKDKTTYDIYQKQIIGQSQLTKINQNLSVTIATLIKLAEWLNCDVKDLINF